jgi:hypothetical protein
LTETVNANGQLESKAIDRLQGAAIGPDAGEVTDVPQLGETRDLRALVPGNPGEVRRTADIMARVVTALSSAGEGLRKIDDGVWTGAAADRFHQVFDGEPQRWIVCGDAFEDAAGAVSGYSSTLEWAQAKPPKRSSYGMKARPRLRQPKPTMTPRFNAPSGPPWPCPPQAYRPCHPTWLPSRVMNRRACTKVQRILTEGRSHTDE